MGTRILETHPQELKFVFELNKHSSCQVQLTNNTFDHVAFKVKTTSPKKYFVRPKVGIIEPKSTREFTIRMQAQEMAPPDTPCKDKFLIQSTVVSADTTDEDITSSLFAKDGSKYIEEKKLVVTLVSPSSSRIDEALKEEMVVGVSEPNNPCTEVEEDLNHETSNKNDEMFNEVDSLPPKSMAPDDVKEPRDANVEEPRDVGEEEPRPASLADEEDLEMIKQVEKLRLKLTQLELKLSEAQVAISKLNEEKRISIQETKFLQQNYSELRKTELKRVQVGFPLLYLYMVALVCTFLGRLLR